MIDLTRREGETYGEIANMIRAELGTKLLPSVVEVKFGGADEAGGFLADPQHIQSLNAILGNQVPPLTVASSRFGSVRSLIGTTVALTVAALENR